MVSTRFWAPSALLMLSTLLGCGAGPASPLSSLEKSGAPTFTQESIEEQSRVVQMLQKQLRERDRRIAVLRSQLEALKLIDQDHEERKRTLKVPATLLPEDPHR